MLSTGAHTNNETCETTGQNLCSSKLLTRRLDRIYAALNFLRDDWAEFMQL